MTKQTNVDELIQKTRQYEYADGLRDMQMAILFLGLGSMVWISYNRTWWSFLTRQVEAHGRWVLLANFIPLLLPVLLVWGALGLINFIRRRWLWHESGMIKAARWQVSRRVNVISAVILLAGLGASYGLYRLGLVDSDFLLRSLWTAIGWSFGYTLIGVGRDIDIPRYVRVGVIGGLASTLLLFIPVTFEQSGLLMGVLWGVLLLVSGFVTLRHAVLNMKERSLNG